jgi:predicted nucleic acid-binding protein
MRRSPLRASRCRKPSSANGAEVATAYFMKLASTHRLRAYDAVQLATALDLHKDWTADRLGTFAFVSADRNLNAAALAEGLTVDDPNSHL